MLSVKKSSQINSVLAFPKLKYFIRANTAVALLLFSIFLITFHSNGYADKFLELTAEEYRDQGYALQQKGNLFEALESYTKAIELGLESAVVLNDIGILYEQLGVQAQAERYYLSAVKLDEQYLPAYINLAYLYQKNGHVDRAAKYFKLRYELAGPNDPWAERAKEELLKISPEFKKELLSFEAERLSQEMVEQAHEEFYERILRANEHHKKGEEFLRSHQYRKAFIEFDYALTLTPKNPKVVKSIAEGYAQKGDDLLKNKRYNEAIKTFEKALEFAEEDPTIIGQIDVAKIEMAKQNISKHSDQAMQLLNEGDLKSAEEEIEKLLGIVEKDGKYVDQDLTKFEAIQTVEDHYVFEDRISRSIEHFQKGEAFFNDLKYQRAILEFDQALKLTPKNPKIIALKDQAELELAKLKIKEQSKRALQLLESGDANSARSEVKKMLGAIPGEPIFPVMEGENDRHGLQETRKAFDDRINYSVEHFQKGEMFLNEGKFQQAILEFDRALEVTPKNPKIIEMREQALVELTKLKIKKNSDEAIRLLESGDSVSAKNEIEAILTTIPSESAINSR